MCEIKIATVVADFIRLGILSRTLNKKFEKATREDIEDLVFQIDQRKNSTNTKNKFRKILKAFYRWLKGFPKGQYPKEVMWITLKKVPLVTVRPEDLLSYDECIRITEHALNLRDKALFQCLLDSGCRIGEVLTVKIGEVEINEGGAVLHSDGKTGESPCILTWSAKTLAIWMNNHPFRHDKEAPLWPTLDRDKPQQMKYDSARIVFKKCVKRAGYGNRRVWLHLLKHVSSTEDAKNGMPDSFRRYKHHWTENSRMPQVYEHLSNSVIPSIQSETWKKLEPSTENKISMVRESKDTVVVYAKCRRCEFENPRDSLFCNRCAFPLKERESAENALLKTRLEIILKKIRDDPEKFERLLSIA